MVICNDIFAYIFGKMYFIVSKHFFMSKSLCTIQETPTINTWFLSVEFVGFFFGRTPLIKVCRVSFKILFSHSLCPCCFVKVKFGLWWCQAIRFVSFPFCPKIWVTLLGYKDEKAGDYTALQVKIILTGAQLFKAHLVYSWVGGKFNYLPLKEDFSWD